MVIDEAYGDFMPNQNSAMTLTEEYPNLIMVRTMSKAFGLAGLRVGYIIAGKPIIRYMKKLRDPYMVSEFAREMAGKALMYPYHFWNNMLDFAKMKREIREALKKAGHLSMAETDDMVSIFVLYHDDPTVDLQKVFWENKVLCVSVRILPAWSGIRPDSAAEDGGFPDSAGSRSADSQRRFRQNKNPQG